jgi:2'-5' RNA ligase
MDYKYLVLFPIRGAQGAHLVQVMDRMAELTGLPAPHTQLPPHVTFHKPIAGINEETVLNLVQSVALQTKQTRLTYEAHPFFFGKQYVVVRINPTIELASFWSEVSNLITKVPEYEHGPFDRDNTLHITLARKTSSVFDKVWGELSAMVLTPEEVTFDSVDLYRKPLTGGAWEQVQSLPIPT